MFYAHGNPPIVSTQAQASNPTTAVLLAEVQGLGGETNGNGMTYEAGVIIGCSTTAQEFWLEQCLSSGLGSTALSTSPHSLGRMVLYGTLQSAQYIVKFRATNGDRLRVRLGAAIGAGTAAGKLIVQAVP